MTCDMSVDFAGTPVSSNNKTDRHDIIEILLKVALKNLLEGDIGEIIHYCCHRII